MSNAAIIKLVAGLVGTIVLCVLCFQQLEETPLILRFLALIAAMTLWAIHVRDWQNTSVLLADTVSEPTQDKTCAQNATLSIWNGSTMKQVGVLVLIDVPDETTQEEVAVMMPRVIDGGFEIFDNYSQHGTDAWEQHRLFVLSNQHTEAFTRCLTQGASS